MNQQKLIDQIHSEFDTAQERLLQDANEVLSKHNDSEFTKAQRLVNIGFTNAKDVANAQNKILLMENALEQATLINYYNAKYPFLKFLTEPELDRICGKYGLIHMPVDNYIGNVPDKNILDIESCQKRDVADDPENKYWCELKRDNSFFLCTGSGGSWCGIWGSEWYRIPKRIEDIHFSTQYDADRYLQELGFTTKYLVSSVRNFTEDRSGLFICAPPSDFKGKNKSISFFEAKVEDPIVFRYVLGGIQVITKWGLEANDTSLVVPKMN